MGWGRGVGGQTQVELIKVNLYCPVHFEPFYGAGEAPFKLVPNRMRCSGMKETGRRASKHGGYVFEVKAD
jgi:hypothetical protein